MTVTITQLSEREFFAWYGLFAEYAAGAGAEVADEHVMRVWTAIQAPGAHAAVAHDESGSVVGFVHAIPFERLLQGDGGFQIEDLFVAPAQRGQGVATALVEHVRTEAEGRRHALLRWSAHTDDAAAKALQDKFADAAGGWVLQTVPVG
ncbi:GNAT family N-acetyltransferase [Amnibacterium kyonggiense]|uniref:Acetyltransferase (GNAT) family protein n=1 Tax=Amnibacterium kyonggiense TaxID=595671 RepID=A0A4R7FMH0_9MICO|nr:GNAT family N-acetyltransferase [Amnibacterium kyonggiense]TDS77670.1 acetyltransferase (GNAT) family protein [Amnibacterium kyonggiense]